MRFDDRGAGKSEGKHLSSSLERFTNAAAGNNAHTDETIPGVNHLFQHCETGLPAEYGAIEETFDPATLHRISNWILEQN